MRAYPSEAPFSQEIFSVAACVEQKGALAGFIKFIFVHIKSKMINFVKVFQQSMKSKTDSFKAKFFSRFVLV